MVIKKKTDCLNKLFEKWEPAVFRLSDDKCPFIPDGIIREELWDKAERKIVFLLKEVNGGSKECSKFDFRESCDKKPWLALGRWAYGLQHLKSAPDFKSFEENACYWKEACRSSAVINLKKPLGAMSTDWKVLQQYAKGDSKNLQSELKIIDPRIVVCCGHADAASVFGISQEISLCGDVQEITNSKAGGISATLYFEQSKGRVWIDFVHPSVRGKLLKGSSYESLYKLLVKVFKEFTDNKQYHNVFP